jgi:outer membrane protein TolC
MQRVVCSCLLIVVAGLPACSDSYWVEDADLAATKVLKEKSVEFNTFRENELIMPVGKDDEDDGLSEEELKDVPRVVGLTESLRVATRFNRGYLSQRESLELSALALTTVQNRFSFFFTGSLGAILTDTDALYHSNINRGELGVSKILPTGGVASVDASTTITGDGSEGGYVGSSLIRVSLVQPLLRDAGYETSHNALTQAERNVVYAIRDFELFREDFTIQVATRYYSLVRQLREIENAKAEQKSRHFLTKQSSALFEVGDASEVDKLRSEREYLRVQNDVITQVAAYGLALDRYKILLGLPTSFPLEIRAEDPVYKDIPVSLESAVDAALNNRLDLLTARDEFEDSEREVRIARNQLQPDLDLDATYRVTSPADRRPISVVFEDNFYTLGLSLELPFERVSERNAFRRSLINLERSRRDLSLQEDNIVLEVRESIRRVKRVQATLDIRKREIAAAEKEERVATYRFDEGEADNQDVSVAQAAVRRARNSYIADLVEFETSRVQLLRDIGILFIDEQGMWIEPGQEP